MKLYSANLWCGIGPPRHEIEDPPKSDRVGKNMAMTPTSTVTSTVFKYLVAHPKMIICTTSASKHLKLSPNLDMSAVHPQNFWVIHLHAWKNCPIWPRFFWDLRCLGPFFKPRNRNRSTQLPHPEIQRHRSSECRGWSTRQKNAGARPKVSASSDKAPTKARAKKPKSVLAMQCGDEFMCYTSNITFLISLVKTIPWPKWSQ